MLSFYCSVDTLSPPKMLCSLHMCALLPRLLPPSLNPNAIKPPTLALMLGMLVFSERLFDAMENTPALVEISLFTSTAVMSTMLFALAVFNNRRNELFGGYQLRIVFNFLSFHDDP